MFKYVGDISVVSHGIIEKYVGNKIIAVDGTLGNGFDCDFLSDHFKKVYAFDIQSIAIENYRAKNKSNVELIQDSHESLKEYIRENIDVAIYNLGFLPGGDKSITTNYSSTIKSIEAALHLLNSGGFVIIAVYIGHEAGAIEGEELLKFTSSLPKSNYGVMLHKFINRSEKSPYLLVIEKK